jgi:hypothetical protein
VETWNRYCQHVVAHFENEGLFALDVRQRSNAAITDHHKASETKYRRPSGLHFAILQDAAYPKTSIWKKYSISLPSFRPRSVIS